MIIEPCKELCHECGFLNDSKIGVLKESLGLKNVINTGQIFPCHLELKAVTGNENKGVEVYVATQKHFKVCRGLVEASFLSNLHMDKPLWLMLYKKLDGRINPKTMNIEEALARHRGY